MIKSKNYETLQAIPPVEQGRAVNPFTDPEAVRLTALNLELAVRNLIQSNCIQEGIVLKADIVSHRLVATPTADGSVQVLVYTN